MSESKGRLLACPECDFFKSLHRGNVSNRDGEYPKLYHYNSNLLNSGNQSTRILS
ncbi:uncharacterized protein BDW43DRAFT_281262 [Aspergillus alliaceus]|uniref:uncharacterized protein n=1 Tax=Petromyces alliaceus TaxID=209559 RepID=UPI0012A501D1|nr:uncharacterized protein BDW43DRAFT_281262 [Aspergillus alliaceus]KAB8231991.1 hypothetical protein BDW43DRAFT_281262 [Aspergillus alliaceus]